ncbi:hypothetical protein O6H91_07G067500 [Diphasiastrum complanatum]|uniref:Uncharacterized protein n=1 Tax=Diphasiastrum complanatum TaxID=34168 RepID=A0ACC2D636_DIPCM|nr:hypothetical protein O6H91_07G067500 [Diphasiastrum complanatum]
MSLAAAAAAAAADVQSRPPRIPLPAPPRNSSGPARPPIIVDREKTCPLLLRVFTKIGGHHSVEEFATRGKEPKDEVQIYTWRDATLRELTDLVKEVAPAARRRDARLSFAFVYPDRRGRNVMRSAASRGIRHFKAQSGRHVVPPPNINEVGMTHANGNTRRPDDTRTLAELSFQTGDFLDVAIYA